MSGCLRRIGVREIRMILSFTLMAAMLMPTFNNARAQAARLGKDQVNSSTESAAITETIVAMFSALKDDDTAKFRFMIAPGFYAFDNGKQIDGDAVIRMIASAHAKGTKFVWNVTGQDVRIFGDHAWIAYKNVGSIQEAGAALTPMTWLESAYLERNDGSWKIVFFQSSRESASSPK